MLRRPELAAATGAVLLALMCGCSSKAIGGPDPIKPQYYALVYVTGIPAPAKLLTLVGGHIELASATLIPYAFGKPGDQRLINDRTGGGSGSGNARDTTVRRGQMMDLKVFNMVNGSGVTQVRDSVVVDVQLQDTVFILTRPHPDPTRSRVDTGYFIGEYLVLTTDVDLNQFGLLERPRRVLAYHVTR